MHSTLRSRVFFFIAGGAAIYAQPTPAVAPPAAVSRPGTPTREEMLAGLTQTGWELTV